MTRQVTYRIVLSEDRKRGPPSSDWFGYGYDPEVAARVPEAWHKVLEKYGVAAFFGKAESDKVITAALSKNGKEIASVELQGRQFGRALGYQANGKVQIDAKPYQLSFNLIEIGVDV